MVPIFMIGTQRSGSNLLRLMLNQLSEIASPHPPHIFERICPLLDAYGDLNIDQNFNQLIDDVCKLVELNPVEWQGVDLDRKGIFSRCKSSRRLAAIYQSIYDIYAEAQGAKTWCCKSLVNVNYIDIIEKHFVDPKYIYLYRDGRDVAISFQKAVVGEKHIYNIATDWVQTQEKALELMDRINADRFFSVSYEQLTTSPEKVAKRLCKFLGVKYNNSMMDFYKTSEAKNAANSSQLWGNVTNPVMRNNSGKYKTEMSEDDLRIFESVAGHILDKLGYSRDLVENGNELKFTKADIELFNYLNKLKKSEITTIVDKHDIKRRQRQSSLIRDIVARLDSEQYSA
ncbi:MAG: sulfotransferase [Gammaproteobacteria bacterium]|nr:sulfotransferase [Gammaproteobacteria bacterium]